MDLGQRARSATPGTRNLTDADGPYVELMAGVFTDNQPDFTFLAPGETKVFTQYWYPIQEIGPVAPGQPRGGRPLRRDAGPATTAVRVAVAVTQVRAGVAVRLTGRGGRDAAGEVEADSARIVRPCMTDAGRRLGA